MREVSQILLLFYFKKLNLILGILEDVVLKTKSMKICEKYDVTHVDIKYVHYYMTNKAEYEKGNTVTYNFNKHLFTL